MRQICLGVLCLLCVVPLGCGDADPEVPSHGLESETLESAPTGSAITLGYDLEDNAAYKAVLSMATEVYKRGTEGGRTKDQTLKLHATVHHTWRFRRPQRDAPMTSSIEVRYVEAEGTSADVLLARSPITGRLAHGPKGAPAPASLHLAGGTKAEQAEVLDLIGSLLLAGYGGSPSWFPPRPVREGEAWALEPFLRPRALANIQRSAREFGVSAPQPRFKGTVRLRRVVPSPQGTLLELELDALIELEGTVRKDDGRTGAMSVGNRLKGLATVNAKTGVPTSFDVSHVHRQRVRSGSDDVTIGGTTTVRGTVTRTDSGG